MIMGVPLTYLERQRALTEYYPVEIQLRTIGMDFWASMEHRITYKKEPAEKQALQKEFLRYEKMIHQVEKGFEKYTSDD